VATVRLSLAAFEMATKEEVLAGIYQNRVFENFGEVERQVNGKFTRRVLLPCEI